MARAEDVFHLTDALSAADLVTWVFGGWAVEAQIPAARRPHEDVDLVVAAADLSRALRVIEALGWMERKPDPCEHLRFERMRGSTKVQVASLLIGARYAWLSVPDQPHTSDAWLPCPREGFPVEAGGTLLGHCLRCATPEVLLQSKLSWHSSRHRDAEDERWLRSVLTESEAARAERHRRPLPRYQCDADCAAR